MTVRYLTSVVLLLAALALLSATKRNLTEVAINGPFQLAIDSKGNLYVAEHYGRRILEIDRSMSSMRVVAGNGKECCFEEGASARSISVDGLRSMTVDSKGNIYFGGVDARDSSYIRKIDAATGTVQTVAGGPMARTPITPEGVPIAQADIEDPAGLVLTKSGSLIVSIDLSDLLAEIAGGQAKRVAGLGEKGYSGDYGLATDATFDSPGFLTSDSKGDLFVADYFNHRIRRIDGKTGMITTVAGNGATDSCGDSGPATEAGVPYPFGVAADSDGNVFLIENGAGTIRMVDRKTGFIYRNAGKGERGFNGDGGPATEAVIDPAAIVLDSAGDLYFSDISDNRIRKIDLHTGIISTVAGNGLPKRKVVIE